MGATRVSKLKPVKGAKVRLLRDVTTRGNRKFRKGLVMTVSGTHGEFFLSVSFRYRHFYLSLKKKDTGYFEVISVPEHLQEEE